MLREVRFKVNAKNALNPMGAGSYKFCTFDKNEGIMQTVMKQPLSKNTFIQKTINLMEKNSLFPKSQRAFVGVSGGIDSVVLLCVIFEVFKINPQKIREIEVIHINHQTRGLENSLEEELVKKLCHDFSLPLHLFYFENQEECHANFEARAREFRYRCFNSLLKEDDVLYLAHHLDDSFEWSLMQQFKSSTPNFLKGIPVKNGQICRPFSFVAKEDLYQYAKLEKISYLDDSSNKNDLYERNFMRNEIIPLILKKYPNALQNYNFQRENALNLPDEKEQTESYFIKKIFDSEDVSNVIGIEIGLKNISTDNFQEEVLRNIIHELSDKERGVLRDQVKKLILSQSINKFGPMTFSGGVKCFMKKGHLLFLNEDGLKYFLNLDDKFLHLLKEGDLLKAKEALQENFPYILIVDGTKGKKVKLINRTYPLFAKTTEYLLAQKIQFSL